MISQREICKILLTARA